MSLQDIITTLNENLILLGQFITSVLFPIFFAAVIFGIGIFLAQLISWVIGYISQLLSVEQILQRYGRYAAVSKENKSLSLTAIVSQISWWLILLTAILTGLQTLGFNQAEIVLQSFANFLPLLVTAVLIVIIGSLLAYFSILFITAIGRLSGFPATTILSTIVTTIICIFSLFFILNIFHIGTEITRILIIGASAAATLGLGLALKEPLADWLKKFRSLKI